MAASAVYLEAINSHFMKHLFLSLAALCAVTVGGWAQCTADFDFMGASFGISPNPLAGEAFADGFVNSPYEDVMHVLTPALSSDIPDLPVDLPIALPVDSITVNSISLVGEDGEDIALEEIGLTLTPNNNGDAGIRSLSLEGGSTAPHWRELQTLQACTWRASMSLAMWLSLGRQCLTISLLRDSPC